MQSQAFIAIVLLVFWMEKPGFATCEGFDVLEIYAGRARINRMANAAGYRCLATDKVYDQHPKSSLELNESAGFAYLSCMLAVYTLTLQLHTRDILRKQHWTYIEA